MKQYSEDHTNHRRIPLFLDDSGDIVQMSTIIEAISSGAHRLSEVASRMGKPVTHLNRPMQRLIDLGYFKRKIPYGIPHCNVKKTLYEIADPFINSYFSYVSPEKTSLERWCNRVMLQFNYYL